MIACYNYNYLDFITPSHKCLTTSKMLPPGLTMVTPALVGAVWMAATGINPLAATGEPECMLSDRTMVTRRPS